MRKEYGHARSLAIAQAQVLNAHDEIKMATTRLCLRDNDDDDSAYAISEHELPAASVQYSSDKFLSLAMLSRVKGKLRYLKVKMFPDLFSALEVFISRIVMLLLTISIISRVWCNLNKTHH